MDLDKTEITIENRLNFGDFNRLWLYPMAPLKRLALIIVGCLLAALLPEIIIKHQIDVFNAVYWFCAALVLNFVGPLALMRGTGIDCNANLKFTPEAIIATLPDTTRFAVDWHNVSYIKREKDGIAIQIMKVPKAVVWLPIRRFASEQEADLFLAIIDRYWSTWLLEKSAERPPATIRKTSDLSVEGDIKPGERILARYFVMRYLIIAMLFLIVINLLQQNFGSCFLPTVICLLPIYLALRETRSQDANVLALAVNAEGLVLLDGSSGYDGTIKWTLFRQIYVFNNLLIIEKNLSQAVIVPLRCFESKEKAAEFVAASKTYMDARKAHVIQKKQG